MANSAVTTFDAEPGKFYLGHFRGISIVVWADKADMDFIHRASAMAEHWKKHYPGKHSNVAFVMNGVNPPTDEARAAFEVQRKTGAIACYGFVLEGDGFWASTLRSTITGVGIAGGGASKIERSLEALVPWLAKEHAARVGEILDEPTLSEALNEARYELAPALLYPGTR